MIRALRRRWLAWRKAREAERTRRELRSLSDRALRDLGLTRGQIELLFR
ncbi:MAG: DUF1127 domain-containing protein [Betaproteobacteria bacterium]